MNADILHLLPKLNDYQLPPEYALDDAEHASSETTDALWHEYSSARNEYLTRKVQHAVVEHVTTTYDAEHRTFETPYLPSEEEQTVLVERRTHVLQTLSEKAAGVQCHMFELQAKHARFQERRSELINLVMLQQSPEYGNDEDDEYDEDLTIDERDMEEKFAALEQKRAALQVSLQTVTQQTTTATKQLAENQSAWESLVEKENSHPSDPPIDLARLIHDPVALERLQAANAEKKTELSKLTETNQYFIDMRMLMEKLSGMRIISVAKAPALDDGLLLRIELYDKYVVDITLCMTIPARNRDFTIASAKFVSDDAALIVGPTIHAAVDDGDTDQVHVVQLRIPPLDDLVKLIESLPTGENVRVLVTEIRARIRIVQDRVSEFSVLLQEPGIFSQIGPWGRGSLDSIPSHLDQHVICSLNALQLTVVLRLSPDFPLTKGSATIDQLIGLGGWDTAVIEGIKECINRQSLNHQSLVAMLRDLQVEVQRLQDEEGVQLPRTPTMPVRRQA